MLIVRHAVMAGDENGIGATPELLSDRVIEANVEVIRVSLRMKDERALTLAEVGTAAAEQNLLVGEGGAELLTAGLDDPWQ